ncbi:MAG: hypothetical protein M1839_009264 [Geoglossum umbratile]|nr:MAG: hypothetical protein M1839_009264 [Geoglossum umbratile]
MAAKSSRPKKIRRDAYLRRSASLARDIAPDPNEDGMDTKKRLYGARGSVTDQSRDDPDKFDIIDGEQDYGSPEPDSYAHKRSRAGDATEWPLRSDVSNNNNDPRNGTALLSTRPSAASLNSGWNPESSYQNMPGRPSRFQEGSMNDRASKNPPSTYTEHYDAVGRYLAEQDNISCMADPNVTHSQPTPVARDKVHRQQASISQNSGGTADSQRSGIWRVGKAIIDWFSYSKYMQEEEEKARQKRILERRQRKAMRVYEELKRTGQLGALGKRGTRSNVNVAAPSYHQTGWNHPGVNNRDSGVDVGDGRHFDRQKGAMPTLDVDQVLMPPPSLPVFDRSGAPSSAISPPPRQSTFFKRPSIPNLKKARSEVHLPSSGNPLPVATSSSSRGQDGTVATNVLRKQPSKKDLQRQQKLSQKVSDLESKLQVARRELSLALGETVPVPPLRSSAANRLAFAPGTLPSLPSESLVLQGVGGDSEANGDLGRAVSDVRSKASTVEAASSRASKVGVGARKSSKSVTPKSSIKNGPIPKSKKRKSAGGSTVDSNYKPDSDTDDNQAELKASKQAPRRKSVRPKKLQKTNTVDDMRSMAMEDKSAAPNNEDESMMDDPRSDILSIADADVTETLSVLLNPANPSESPSSPGSPLLSGNPNSKSQDPSVPPIPRLPTSIERIARLTSGSNANESANVDPKKRPQPEKLKEPYEWPEDVF